MAFYGCAGAEGNDRYAVRSTDLDDLNDFLRRFRESHDVGNFAGMMEHVFTVLFAYGGRGGNPRRGVERQLLDPALDGAV